MLVVSSWNCLFGYGSRPRTCTVCPNTDCVCTHNLDIMVSIRFPGLVRKVVSVESSAETEMQIKRRR
ncbi:hypothetical protein AcV5_007658 [Taiwanofungus camphoratus]|nr:hypothetical protein AcV5_007658 [Antrodia cinnamomea]